MFEAYSNDVLWIVVIGFLVAFFLAFGVGANDVANSFGTSVGSKVLTLTQACILATIFEILGALLMGFKVSDTIRKDIYDLDMYENEEKVLMMGNMAALFGSATWNIIATLLRLPISGTHSIVGAVLGFTLVVKGFRGIQWKTLGFIVSSWFLSPVLSGVVSVIIFLLIRKFILSKDKPSQVGVAFIYIISVFINVLSIVLDGSPVLYLDRLPPWLAVVISAAVGIIVGVIIQFLIVGNKKKQVPIEQAHEEISLENPISKDENLMLTDDDHPEVRKLFKGLQIMTAIFGSFAHGGNDVSNAIAPLISLWLLYTKDTNGSTPAWLLIYGGFGISIGLWVMGRKVIQTMGQDLTKITPLSGFTIEIGATTTVLLASKIGIPISTTHCKVGSIVFVGMTRSTNDVDFKLFKNIILAWLVTLPFTGVISGLTMLVLYSTTIS
ncbi:sodium-dependent phosphate transporter 1-A [Parasteatoda tepidariorum]|uniref:sodium-dependent phosphate transporter 1-A n=1 Tax=Parasteatoda tepidariorum TaxID=114398 RepID=UPI001C724C64|nr:sodium-dependent phosphate transporter 1-B isoform X1 [Parasteatoda tepidariorum]